MEWLKKLQSLLNITINIDLSSLKEVKLFNSEVGSNSNVNSNVKVTTDADKKLLQINLKNLNDTEKAGLQELLPSAFEESGNLLEDSARNTVDDYREVARASEFVEVIDYFSPLIPPSDIPILRAALYLKACFDRGLADIAHLKREITEKYGTRGRNIANLYTAGYFQDWLKPYYEALKNEVTDEAMAKEAFLRSYDIIVTELPWTIFVSYANDGDEIKSQILAKLNKNIQYGIRFLNIHGLGAKNVSKIRAVVNEVEEEDAYPNVHKLIEEEGNRIFVKLRILPNND